MPVPHAVDRVAKIDEALGFYYVALNAEGVHKIDVIVVRTRSAAAYGLGMQQAQDVLVVGPGSLLRGGRLVVVDVRGRVAVVDESVAGAIRLKYCRG